MGELHLLIKRAEMCGGKLVKKRSCLGHIIDILMVILTDGVWLIWMLARYLKRKLS